MKRMVEQIYEDGTLISETVYFLSNDGRKYYSADDARIADLAHPLEKFLADEGCMQPRGLAKALVTKRKKLLTILGLDIDAFGALLNGQWNPKHSTDGISGTWVEDGSSYTLTCPEQLRELLINLQHTLHDLRQ